MKTLIEYGEKKLVKRIKEIADNSGSSEPLILDDAAPVCFEGFNGRISVTTDPCPIPNMVQHIGIGNYYHAGWLCVVKSLSDIAAVGAKPLGICLAVEFPREMKIDNFDAFFKGAAECAVSHGTRLLGGNIKETRDKSHAVSFGMGVTYENIGLSRGLPKHDDVLFLVDKNDFGGFWAGVMTWLQPEQSETLGTNTLDTLRLMALKPRAKIEEGAILLKDPPSFCMDTSDGLLTSATEIAHLTNADVVLQLDDLTFTEPVQTAATMLGCDARIWGLGWGSYQLLCAADNNIAQKAIKALEEIGSHAFIIGRIRKGLGRVLINAEGKEHFISGPVCTRGEQFHPDSFWKRGINDYINLMKSPSVKCICDIGG